MFPIHKKALRSLQITGFTPQHLVQENNRLKEVDFLPQWIFLILIIFPANANYNSFSTQT
jgi:hypothetical protein